MTTAIHFDNENQSNAVRDALFQTEPLALRTFTPSQAVLAKSAGCYHWTPEGRRLYDFTSGVLVANLGHNPRSWMKRFCEYMGWKPEHVTGEGEGEYFDALTLTAYNAVTSIETEASKRLIASIQSFKGGNRCDKVMWAASGSEAVQKALWACLHRDPERDIILATRYGFHGKKGLAGAVTGSETDADRDPRVKFISFPRTECDDISKADDTLDVSVYQKELEDLWTEYGTRINCLITEPYLGGGGSYHPQVAYHKVLQDFCRAHDIMLILDEVQANFGRTGCMYAFEKYQIEPDFVVLGKGLGNGVPVAAAVGRNDVIASLKYGEASDTWSANPLSSAAVLATLDEFESTDVMDNTQKLSQLYIDGLNALKETGVISKVRGEGMVFGIECAELGGKTSQEVAIELVKTCYLGEADGDGIHLLGALAGNVLRVSPPMTMTEAEAETSIALLNRLCVKLAEQLQGATASA
ncbi:aminotransferase class III-fold pyridoxal phosphate-dependent enzyme [Gimesia sp.]|uniref:aminotransferase class III-fold pyridoxal phosphate-dependent enzyme n=1 Tax=Gimesia sp. TaxID=2024833 RepID=UPI000C452A8E|nr:aminotransferase class III-fold pyridoxal phosphate-dependent enzyme [Gimesia sp.]MAX39296.1 aspartate aminotransferase family protein [Gimesia sp.]|tara:strand:- start:8174 stop:9580 length:1407 start_codon:yes stop_codon:yes gene_type:complete